MSVTVGVNSYVTVAEADAYFSDRANADWTALTTPQKESALILGCDYLEATYGSAWQGYRVSAGQILSWPRDGVYVEGVLISANETPLAIKRAQYEMALRASAGEPLIADQGQRVTEERVDVLTVKYAEFSDPAMRYPYANRLVLPYLRSAVTEGGIQTPRLVRT